MRRARDEQGDGETCPIESNLKVLVTQHLQPAESRQMILACLRSSPAEFGSRENETKVYEVVEHDQIVGGVFDGQHSRTLEIDELWHYPYFRGRLLKRIQEV